MKTSRINLGSNLKHGPFLLSENYLGNVMNSKLRLSIHEANRHIKRCSTSIMIREMQNKTTKNCHLPAVRMAITEKSTHNTCWRKCGENSYTVGGNVNWYSHYGKQYGLFLKKLKIEWPRELAIPLLGTYPDKIIIRKDTRTPLFIAILFTTAKRWKQPKCPLRDE